MSEWLHPAGPCLAGAFLVLVVPRPVRSAVALVAAAIAVGLAWTLPDGQAGSVQLMGQSLVMLRADALGRTFALIFALITGLAVLYAFTVRRRGFHCAALTAAAAALGIALAGDWVTLYLAWELLALASFVLILDGGTGAARAAAFRYLLVHVSGGALFLAGLAWHRAAGGGPLIEPLDLGGPGFLVLGAFAINAAIPPLHAWLTDAYPESSSAGGVLLSAFATKAAVYALARVFPGHELLVWAGTAMAVYGVVFAVLENDMRRLLGYHIVSQVGYMVTGVGLGTPLGVSGAAAHAFCHILYKGLLFMGTGTVIHATGRRKLTELGGLAPLMPATFALYMVGAFSISGAPLLNGFVSKSLVVAAAEAEHRTVVVWLLTLASVGTFLHTGLKLPYFTFGGAERGLRPSSVPTTMLAAMTLTAALCAATGIHPAPLYALLPFPVQWEPYTFGHVMESLQLLAGTAVGFALLRRHLGGEPTVTLDTDHVYRAFGRWVAHTVAPAVARVADWLEDGAMALAGGTMQLPLRPLPASMDYALMVAVAVLGLALAVFAALL